jgi:hypothetical protein
MHGMTSPRLNSLPSNEVMMTSHIYDLSYICLYWNWNRKNTTLLIIHYDYVTPPHEPDHWRPTINADVQRRVHSPRDAK